MLRPGLSTINFFESKKSIRLGMLLHVQDAPEHWPHVYTPSSQTTTI